MNYDYVTQELDEIWEITNEVFHEANGGQTNEMVAVREKITALKKYIKIEKGSSS